MTAAPGPNDRDAYGQPVYQRSDLYISDGVNLIVQRGSQIRDGAGTDQLALLGLATRAVLTDYADDAAAQAGGVAIGGLYRTASAVKVRVA